MRPGGVLLAVAAIVCGAAGAAELDAVRARGELVWAADQEGGGPHVFVDPDAPTRLVGFEVELAALIAGELGVKPRFQQGQWDRLPLLLGRTADCVINGIELTPERRRDYRCSRSYFAYALQLVARRDAPPPALAALATPSPAGRWRIGVLTGSAAETAARAGGWEAEVVGYDGTVDSLEQLAGGVLDAVLMDDCIFNFYADRFPTLRTVERPFAGGSYTVLTAPDTPRLAAEIDAAIGRLIGDGRLKSLYDRWDLAGRQQMLLLRDATEVPPASRGTLAELVRDTLPLLLRSAGITLFLSCVAFPLAVLIGLAVAVGRTYGPPFLRPLLAAYVEFLRGTPLLLQLYAIYFLLPKIGLALRPCRWD
jgi:polar amino acid transport system substrate-binding protein